MALVILLRRFSETEFGFFIALETEIGLTPARSATSFRVTLPVLLLEFFVIFLSIRVFLSCRKLTIDKLQLLYKQAMFLLPKCRYRKAYNYLFSVIVIILTALSFLDSVSCIFIYA
jgi:hypothetical protein